MKNKLQLAIAFVLLSSSAIYSQQFASRSYDTNLILNLYSSYVFQDSFDSYYSGGNYAGQLQDGLQYGGGIEYIVGRNQGIELSYIGQTTTAPTTFYYANPINNKTINYDVQMNYIMFGGNKYFRPTGSKVEGFGGLMIGMNVVNISNSNALTNKQYPSQNLTKFAWGLKGGAIVWMTDKVGLKLQAQILSTSQSFGGGFYLGSGGSGAAVSSYSSVYQFSLGGGLVFDFDK